YDDETLGNNCYTNTTILTTGNWGEWGTTQQGVNTACGNYTKEYFLEITIDGDIQAPRRRLLFPNYVLKNSSATFWNITANNVCYSNQTGCNTTNVSYYLNTNPYSYYNVTTLPSTNLTNIALINQSIEPTSNSVFSIGSSILKYLKGWFVNLDVSDTIVATNINVTNVTIGGHAKQYWNGTSLIIEVT
ncbi:MAG TPA: hypothetical protein VI911_00040, partial [Patescibacteria group bacterium]|nr:hypothetical protein [Patescibacteria group bacterium]